MSTSVENKEDAFVRHLQGESIEDSHPLVKQSAQLVLDILDHPAVSPVPPLSNERLNAFQNRLQQVRVPVQTKVSPWNLNWTRGLRVAVPLAACLLVGVLVLGPDASNQLPEYDQWRDLDEAAIVSVSEPVSSANALTAQLTVLGITARLGQHNDVVILEAYVPESRQDDVDRLLTPYSQRVGKNGELIIGFKSK